MEKSTSAFKCLYVSVFNYIFICVKSWSFAGIVLQVKLWLDFVTAKDEKKKLDYQRHLLRGCRVQHLCLPGRLGRVKIKRG